jgi:hypothetical protein
MIIQPSGVDKALGVHLQKIYKTNATVAADATGGRDAVSISKFSALVERAHTQVMAMPDVRADRIAQVRSSLDLGESVGVDDIASAMINKAAGGQV